MPFMIIVASYLTFHFSLENGNAWLAIGSLVVFLVTGTRWNNKRIGRA